MNEDWDWKSIGLILMLFFFLGVLFYFYQLSVIDSKNEFYSKSNTNNFAFTLSYGVRTEVKGFKRDEGRNKIDTIDGRFTKDMVLDPDITTKLVLTDDEMQFILYEMKRINILSYPSVFQKFNNQLEKNDFVTYRFDVRYREMIKIIYWDDDLSLQSDEAVNLRNLAQKIISIVQNNQTYRAMPSPRGSY